MLHLFFSVFIAFAITLICLFSLKPLALRFGLIALPDSRKHHKKGTPLIGGIAMFMGFLAAMLTLPIALKDYRSFIAGTLLLIFIGILDDFYELSPKIRFLVQSFSIVLIFFWDGIKLTYFGDLIFYKPIILGVYSFPVTLIAGLGVINAINMIDGIDGLAGTLVLIELILLMCCAALKEQFLIISILLIVATTILAFLLLNFRFPGRLHAYVFMGDAGAMFLGFILVWFLIKLSQPGPKAITPVTMLWIMILPLFDTTAIILHRLSKKKSIFSSDREHLHYLLLEFSLTPSQICILLGFSNLLLGIFGLLAFYYQVAESVMFMTFLIFFILYFICLLYLRRKLSQKKRRVVFAHLLREN